MSYNRKRQDKHRLKKLSDETWHSYRAGAYYNDRKNRYIRYSCHNHSWKKYCRKVTRHKLKSMIDFSSNCAYKKLFDYWWTIL